MIFASTATNDFYFTRLKVHMDMYKKNTWGRGALILVQITTY